jgi:hypothetical protein
MLDYYEDKQENFEERGGRKRNFKLRKFEIVERT